MRTSRFRPAFDVMDRRMTPSDLAPIPTGSTINTPPPDPSGFAQDFTDPQIGPITWVVAGNPPPPTGGDYTDPGVGPLTWVVENP